MIKWDVEFVLTNEEGEEVDYLRVPYRSERMHEFFVYCAGWFPLKDGLAAKLVVTHRPDAQSLGARIIQKNAMSIWVAYKGEQLRPRDAIRKMMAEMDVKDG